MALRHLLLAGMATSASAVKLLVSGYGPTGDKPNGYVSTLDYTYGTLKKVAENIASGPQPAWIDLSLPGKAVVVDEAWNTPDTSSIHTFTINSDKSLKQIAVSPMPLGGPVSTQFYNKNANVAVAHYGGSGINTLKVGADGNFTVLQTFNYKNRTDLGPVKPNQEAAHVHHSVLDPTGQYIIFPDLGLDATHVFCIDKSGKLSEHAELKAPAGYGPRHATFWKSGSTTYLFVIHELANKLISYKVDYVRSGGLTFKQIDEVSTYGQATDATKFGAAAEIAVSPDNKFVLASNRNVTFATQVPNVDPNNATMIDSNSIATFKPSADGKLAFVQLAPSGGLFPRHFELSKDGSQIAIANQNSGNVRIYKRDVASGKIGEQAAAVALPGSPNNVRWL